MRSSILRAHTACALVSATACLAVATASGAAFAQGAAVRLDHPAGAPVPDYGAQGPVALSDFQVLGQRHPVYAFRELPRSGDGGPGVRAGTARVAAGVVSPANISDPSPPDGAVNLRSEGTSFSPTLMRVEGIGSVYALPVVQAMAMGESLSRANLFVGRVTLSGTTPSVPARSLLQSAFVCGFDTRYRLRIACVQEGAASKCVAVWTGASINAPVPTSATNCSMVETSTANPRVYGLGVRIPATGPTVFDAQPTPIGAASASSFDPHIVHMRNNAFLVAYVSSATDPGTMASTSAPAVATVVLAGEPTAPLTVIPPSPETSSRFVRIATSAEGHVIGRDSVALAVGDGLATPNRATLAYVSHVNPGGPAVVFHTLELAGAGTATLNAPIHLVRSFGTPIPGFTFTDLDLDVTPPSGTLGGFGFLVAVASTAPAGPFDAHYGNLFGWRLTRTMDGFQAGTPRRFPSRVTPGQLESASAPSVTGAFDGNNQWLVAYTSQDEARDGRIAHAYAQTAPVHGLLAEPCSPAAPCVPEFVCSADGVCVLRPDAAVDGGADAALDAPEDTLSVDSGATDVGSDESAVADAPDVTVDAPVADVALDAGAPPTDAPAVTDAVPMDTNTMTDSARPDAPVGPPVDDGISPTPNPGASFHGGSCSCDVAGRPLDARTNAGPASLVAGLALAALARTLRRRRAA